MRKHMTRRIRARTRTHTRPATHPSRRSSQSKRYTQKHKQKYRPQSKNTHTRTHIYKKYRNNKTRNNKTYKKKYGKRKGLRLQSLKRTRKVSPYKYKKRYHRLKNGYRQVHIGGSENTRIIVLRSISNEDELMLAKQLGDEAPSQVVLSPQKARERSVQVVNKIKKFGLFGPKGSYSPSVNKMLNLIEEGEKYSPFGCEFPMVRVDPESKTDSNNRNSSNPDDKLSKTKSKPKPQRRTRGLFGNLFKKKEKAQDENENMNEDENVDDDGNENGNENENVDDDGNENENVDDDGNENEAAEGLEDKDKNMESECSEDGCCVFFTNPRTQKMLLRNLASTKTIECEQMITPQQAESNCWFNTMFVMFFMSDKGRKFFKYFRAMMILGVRGALLDMTKGSIDTKLDELKEITKEGSNMVLRSDMHRVFFMLNMAIEACLSGHEYAYALNTNDLILQIYEAITQHNPSYISKIETKGMFGNPFEYYNTLMKYLSDDTIRIHNFFVHPDDMNTNRQENVDDDEEYDNYESVNDNDNTYDYKEELMDEIERKMKSGEPPHILLVWVSQTPSQNMLLSNMHHDETLSIGGVRYKLDAALLRSSNKMHWTCLITCNGKGYAYDGASYTRLVPFDWKSEALNQDAKYHFESTTSRNEYAFHIDWHALVYYRDT